jgi:hypothetical protein
MSTDGSSFRERLQGDLNDRYDTLIQTIESAMQATRDEWVDCPHCNKRSKVQVRDTRAAISAAEFFANQAEGRPGVASDGEAAQGITFVRVNGAGDASKIYDAAVKFLPKDALDAFHAEAAYTGGET